jgi:hypothetical protein
MQFSIHRLLLPAIATVLTMLSAAAAQQPLGELFATDARVKGSVILAGSGTSVLSGSSIEAGARTATLKLERGGSLLVCQGTKLSIAASQSGRELMFSMNSGSLEMDYPLGANADTLLTPDLRLLLPGPGMVHVAVQVTPQGDTCVQSLPSNATAIVVSETMGDATYQVKPDQAVLFSGGHLSEAVRATQDCGCPAPSPTNVAKAAPLPPPPPPASTKPAQPAVAPIPKPPPEEHVAVEAPFVFRANDPVPDLTQNVVRLKLERTKIVQLEPVVVLPPQAKKSKSAKPAEVAKKPARHGFFSRVAAFFATLFH